MKKRHGVAWWVCIGWWWYLMFAWWLLPLVHLLSRKKEGKSGPGGGGSDRRRLEDTMGAVVDALRELGGSALQVDVKKRLPAWAASCFDEAVHELYENGRVRMSKDGSRVRLDLV